MKNQTQRAKNTINTQKKVVNYNKKTERLYPCANEERNYSIYRKETEQCKEFIVGKIDKEPDRGILGAYCEECQKKYIRIIDHFIPKKAMDADLSRCDNAIIDYFNNKRNEKGLYLWGNVGVGKSWAEYAMIKRLIMFDYMDYIVEYCSGKRISRGCIITSMTKIYDELQTGQFDKRFNASEYKQNLCDIRMLMIDDFGMEKMSDFRQEILETIINTRYENNKITFFTSNYNLDQLVDRVGGEIAGKRIISRIIEMCEIIELEGKDRRLKK